jgi:quinol monooxygenase YgiN
MPVLEVCKRRLKDGITHTDPELPKIFAEIRSATNVDFVFYSSIENPSDFFALGVWPSKAAWDKYVAWDEEPPFMTALTRVSDFEWIEFAEVNSIKSLPIYAPVMTVTRAFLKGDDNPKEYYRKISDLKGPIEAETKPHPCVFSWTIDTVPESQHKWLMFVGWKSKKHHQDYAEWLRRTPGFEEFPTIPEHYDEGTTHNQYREICVGRGAAG